MDTQEAVGGVPPGEDSGAAPQQSTGEAPRGGTRDLAAVRLADRYDISPAAVLPDFASPQAPAVAAVDTRGATKAILALVCPRHLGLREETLGSARRIERGHVLRVIDWGVVDWPLPGGSSQRQPVVIIERPGGSRLMPRDAERIDPLGEEALVRRVLRPLANALRDLHSAGITHRGIRPDNLFWREGAGGDAVLGEGWVAPPGSDQPALYETITNGMAQAPGRGNGRPSDDLYALGATLAVLLAGVNPAAQLDDHAMLAAKIGQGSFSVLAGTLRLSTPMAEVLRGLLADNPQDRWTVDDLDLWFDGRRLSPKAPNLPLLAQRPLAFAETDYWSRQALAHGLARRWTQAVGFLPEAGLAIWLKRSLGEEKRSVAADAILAGGGESGRNGADHQLARLLMLLDPAAPVRYREIAAHVDGFGGLLADSLDRGPVLQQVVQAVTQKLPAIWVDQQEDPRLEHANVRKAIDMMIFFLGKTGPGFGIERCLYEANPGLPCRSPLFESDYLTRIQDVLAALDRAAKRNGTGTDLLDRHVAAFIGARLGTSADGDLTRFGTAKEPSERCVGLLRILAMVQATTNIGELPHFGAWVAAQLKPLIESFHHRPFRDALAKEIGPLCYRGDFVGLVRLVENDDLRQRDASGFGAARKRYAALLHDARWIRGGGLTSTARLQDLAQQASAVVAGSVAAVASGAVLIYIIGLGG